MNKYLVWEITGGLGKNINATAILESLKLNYQNRQIIIVCSYPSVFLNNPYVDRVYEINKLNYFYEDYFLNKDTLFFKNNPYNFIEHINKKQSLIESWCKIFNIKFENQLPKLYLNYAQQTLVYKWVRDKPLLLLQTHGGIAKYQNNELITDPYDWTRDLPIEIAQSIVKKYSSKYHIIQLTREGGYFLENVERIDQIISNQDLFALVLASQNRILIDSAAQHIARALDLKSIVFWIGTSCKVYGYDFHYNINAMSSLSLNQLIESYDFEYRFDNNHHECPYNSIEEMFNIPNIMNNLETLI